MFLAQRAYFGAAVWLHVQHDCLSYFAHMGVSENRGPEYSTLKVGPGSQNKVPLIVGNSHVALARETPATQYEKTSKEAFRHVFDSKAYYSSY